jgi:hypothetical protein
MNNEVTFVTGLWDLGRDKIGGGFRRDFNSHYLPQFQNLLAQNINLIIFCDKEVEEFVWRHRDSRNTVVINKPLDSFKTNFDFYNQVQNIRNKPEWKNQAGWLADSPQSSLEYYNPVVMSKFFMLHDSCIMNPFNTEHFYWIDAGISSTVNLGYFSTYNVHEKLTKYVSSLLFVCFPYDGQVEVHGFTKSKFNECCNANSEYVARGGFFGGRADYIKKFNPKYYDTLRSTLNEGYMGTEESIFTILCYLYPEDICRVMIEGNGLLNTIFEALKNDSIVVERQVSAVSSKIPTLDDVKVYVLTFNSCKQLELLLNNFTVTYPELIAIKDKVLINNSTERSYDECYKEIADRYGFIIQNFNNIGICGARQWVAEDFERSDKSYYIFFEDDMLFNIDSTYCKNGFGTKANDLFNKCLKIIEKETLDYLKISFSEFFGGNNQQWAYCNVPQQVRLDNFGDLKLQFPRDYDKIPGTVSYSIGSFEGLPYAIGEFYYCNWPLLFTKQGNRKVFLDTKWGHPYEQTWMSYVFQEQRKKNIKAGCLLLSPIAHNRVYFYKAQDRRES